ncbi:head-tail connector protein [Clostridium perfringens]|uniref:head-tail connector protein n=1 Tax=Clostridium perfringens TaxID=1502 RepID=UPI001CCCD3CE|nr:head-tail connector protein [Clostridium perfringens]MEA5268957.1 head-tail connector protein [Clostridium perfringens]MEA5271587.1 head-tail connector protein [Clostridium perfringens]MEA5342117.1 head-tail connector protein [Clostridium perfringens]MEA5380647.1 head-tail connector protein [Clostridium perfringens]UBK67536.1 head-tail connector protein [Clostridium perfringens]
MILSLKEVKNYLRVDYEEDDLLIQDLIDMSEEYLYNATGKKFTEKNKLAKRYCLALIYDWYKDKGMNIRATKNTTVSEKVKYTLQSVLLQLKFCKEDDT